MKKGFTGIRDLDIKILNSLDDKDLIRISVCNKYIFRISNEETFWKNRLIFKYSGNLNIEKILENKPDDRTWRNYYIQIVIDLKRNSIWNFIAMLRLGNKGIENSSYYDGHNRVKNIPEWVITNYYLKNLGSKIEVNVRFFSFARNCKKIKFIMENSSLVQIHEKILPYMEDKQSLALLDSKKTDKNLILIFSIMKS